MPPFEIQVFAPFSTQQSRSRRAVVDSAATSEPASGSESANAAIASPAATRGRWAARCASDTLLADAQALAKSLADGPTFAHAMTKKCIHQEWSMGIDESIEAEAQAQAICMQTKDYERAYNAFVAKQRPVFEGN